MNVFDYLTLEDELKEALVLVDEEVIDILLDDGRSLCFYNLGFLDPSYSNHFAISSEDSLGNNVILINNKFKDAGKEALACLITHEAYHRPKNGFIEMIKSWFGKKSKVSFQEELYCTQMEAAAWTHLKPKEYSVNDLTIRLDRISQNYESIGDIIKNNPAYSELEY